MWVVIALVVVLILLFIFTNSKKENLTVLHYNDVSMQAADPSQTFYTMREKDPTGMTSIDYFLETQRMRDSEVWDIPEDGESNFRNYTDFIEMPVEFRPRGSSSELSLNKKHKDLESMLDRN